MKTLLLGLDGFDPDYHERFDLPNIKSIGDGFEISTHGNSGPSWASVLTGLTPNGHGVRKLEPQQDQQSWQGTPIWEKVDGYSGIANCPLTYPPKELDGWMVTGMMTPARAIYTYPRSLYKDLDDIGYRIDVWVDDHKNHPNGAYGTIPFDFTQEYRDELLENIDDVIRRRGEAFEWLIENEPADFVFLTFTSLDRAQHLAMDDEEEMRQKYELLDEQVGKVLDVVPEETEIFVTSDHGFQEIDLPDTDIVGEHRRPGYGATNIDRQFSDLEDLHRKVVESANRTDVRGRLEDLGYLE